MSDDDISGKIANAAKKDKLRKKFRISRSMYDRMVKAASEYSSLSEAAEACGVSRATMTKAMEIGWPDESPYFQPIKQVLAEDQSNARAQLVKLDEQAAQRRAEIAQDNAEKAALDAARTRAEEGQAVRMIRGNALALIGTTTHLLKAALKKASQLTDTIDDELMSANEIGKLMKTVSDVTRNAGEVAKLAIQLERTVLGEPTEHIKVSVDNMTTDDAAEEIRRAQAALDRAVKLGIVIDVEPEEDDSAPK